MKICFGYTDNYKQYTSIIFTGCVYNATVDRYNKKTRQLCYRVATINMINYAVTVLITPLKKPADSAIPGSGSLMSFSNSILQMPW